VSTPLLQRLARRLRWEFYSAKVLIRRLILDLAFSPARQARCGDAIPSIAADGWIRSVPAPAAIEPAYGYVVHGKVSVLDDSLMYSEDVRIRSQRKYFSGVPTVLGLLRRGTPHFLGPLASVRNPYDSNYYHAVVDCLGAVALMVDAGLMDRRTLVVGPGLASTAVFSHAAERGALRDITWIVQGDDWLATDSDIVFGRSPNTCAALRRTSRFLTTDLPIAGDGPSKLYVTRPKSVGRALRNDDDLRIALERRGFVAVDPGSLLWPDQVNLFHSARWVVGIHGAALTNIIFREAGALHLVEIHAPHRRETNYQELADGLGFSYSAVVGSQTRGNTHWDDFEVDVDAVLSATTAFD
jgi:hypothetical protein